MPSPGKAFYDRHIAYLTEQNIEALVENQYHPDAVLVSFDAVVRGHDALRQHFAAYLGHLGKIDVLSTDHFAEIDDAIFFEATVETNLGVAVVYDVFTFKEGKAIQQFTGVKEVRSK